MLRAGAAELQEVLSFEVGGRSYAIPAASVREIVRAVAIEPLPGAPGLIEGVINVRGEAVAVLDVRARFGIPPKPVEPSDYLVLLAVGWRTVALRVDRVIDLVRVDAEPFGDVRGLPGVRDLSGVAKLPDGILLIGNVRSLLEDAEAAGLPGLVVQPTLWDQTGEAADRRSGDDRQPRPPKNG